MSWNKTWGQLSNTSGGEKRCRWVYGVIHIHPVLMLYDSPFSLYVLYTPPLTTTVYTCHLLWGMIRDRKKKESGNERLLQKLDLKKTLKCFLFMITTQIYNTIHYRKRFEFKEIGNKKRRGGKVCFGFWKRHCLFYMLCNLWLIYKTGLGIE